MCYKYINLHIKCNVSSTCNILNVSCVQEYVGGLGQLFCFPRKIVEFPIHFCLVYLEAFAPLILIGCETQAKNKLYVISNLKLSVLSSGLSIIDLRLFIFRALFCDSLVLKVIRVAVLICSVAIFC
jgi:hypothetical protein